MAPCLFPSFLAVTRRPSPSQPASKFITQFISQLATYTTAFDERIRRLLSSSASSQFPKVLYLPPIVSPQTDTTQGSRQDGKSDVFRDFRQRLFHGCLVAMNGSVKAYMTTWDIVRCADDHFRRVIYGIGPYIADYPEQSTAAGTVYGWCVTLVLLL